MTSIELSPFRDFDCNAAHPPLHEDGPVCFYRPHNKEPDITALFITKLSRTASYGAPCDWFIHYWYWVLLNLATFDFVIGAFKYALCFVYFVLQGVYRVLLEFFRLLFFCRAFNGITELNRGSLGSTLFS